jgi:hypothetical protein
VTERPFLARVEDDPMTRRVDPFRRRRPTEAPSTNAEIVSLSPDVALDGRR